MSGGALIRAAAASAVSKVPAPPPHFVKKSSIPASAMLASSSGADVAAVRRKAAWEDDLVMAAGEPIPRVVFAGAPTFDEAKEATHELTDALDKVYLSTPSELTTELTASNNLNGLSLVSSPDADNGSRLVVETGGTLSAAPNHALRAFRLLATNTEVQDVVASIASDKNVWKAVMHNSVVQEFIQSNQTSVEFQEPVFPEDSSAEPGARGSGSWFSNTLENAMRTFEKIKLTAVDLVTFLLSKFNNIFGYPSDIKGDPKTGFADTAFGVGASFIGLATMVVMVVLLRRL